MQLVDEADLLTATFLAGVCALTSAVEAGDGGALITLDNLGTFASATVVVMGGRPVLCLEGVGTVDGGRRDAAKGSEDCRCSRCLHVRW